MQGKSFAFIFFLFLMLLFPVIVHAQTLPQTSPLNSIPGNVLDLSATPQAWNIYSYNGGANASIVGNSFNIPYPPNSTAYFSGSDVVSNRNFTLQQVEFDALFDRQCLNSTETLNVPANEMAIFFTNNIDTYKGLEIGIIADFYYENVQGYFQDGNGTNVTNFQVTPLALNDGLIHHYRINLESSTEGGTTFFWYVDGVLNSTLTSPSNYTKTEYHAVFVTHRFTSDWDSQNSSMLVGNLKIQYAAFDSSPSDDNTSDNQLIDWNALAILPPTSRTLIFTPVLLPANSSSSLLKPNPSPISSTPTPSSSPISSTPTPLSSPTPSPTPTPSASPTPSPASTPTARSTPSPDPKTNPLFLNYMYALITATIAVTVIYCFRKIRS